LVPGHFLLNGLQNITDSREAERIRQSLAALANRLLSVHSVTPGDLERVQPALEEIRDTLNIALEHLTEGQASRTAQILRDNDVRSLFKSGFNRIAELRSRAERLVSERLLWLEDSRELLVESRHREFLSGIRRLQPRFFEGLEDPSKSGYRNFQRLHDIELAKQTLNEIGLLGRCFWKLFPEETRERLVSCLSGCALAQAKEAVRFSHIFNSALAGFLHDGRFQPRVLSAPDLDILLKTLVTSGLDEERLFSEWSLQAKTVVSNRVPEEADRILLSKHCEAWTRELVTELAGLRNESPIDPGWIRSLLLKKSAAAS
jgi:hypothetical protein